MTRLPSCHWANSAKSTVIHMSGPVGKSQILPKNGKGILLHDGKFRSRCCSRTVVELQGKFVFYIVFAVLIDSLSAASLRNDDAHQQALGNGRDNPKTKKRTTNKQLETACETSRSRYRTSQIKSRGCRSASTRKHFSRLTVGTSYGSGIQEAWYFYSLPKDRVCKRTKMTWAPCRRVKWQSSSSSRKIW